jgi:hypothetical protein
MAVVNGVFIGLKQGVIEAGDELLIQTDCEAVIQAVLNRRNSISERELEALAVLRKLQAENNLNLEFRHVKAHTRGATKREWVNNFVDKAARKAMRSSRAKNTRGRPNP